MMAGGAFFDIDVEGVGAHGARPEAGGRSGAGAAHITAALQSIVARNVRPVRDRGRLGHPDPRRQRLQRDPPDARALSGTVRAFSNEVMQLIERNLARVAEGVAAGFGARAKVDFRLIFPPLLNDAREAEFAAGICAEVVGTERVRRRPAADHGVGGLRVHAERECPAATSTSATATARAPARCTTRPMTSTTARFLTARAFSPGWSSGGSRGSARFRSSRSPPRRRRRSAPGGSPSRPRRR